MIDLDTGVETTIGNTGITSVFGFSFNPVPVAGMAGTIPGGTLFGAEQGGNLYTIDIDNAVATFIGNTGLGGVEALTFDLTGNLFAGSQAPLGRT